MNIKSSTDLKENSRAAYIKYIAALLLFGSNGIMANFIHIESYQIILMRTFLGSLLLLILATGKHVLSGLLTKRKDFMYVALSGICMGTSWMFQYEAYRQIGISITSLLYCLGPIFTVLLAQFIFQERITLKKILCLAAVSCGAILTGGLSLKQGANAIGILCALLCALAYAGMIMFNKKNQTIIGLSNSIVQLVFGFLTALIYNLGRWISSSAPAIHLSAGEWVPVLILGLVNTGIGCYLYFSSISEIPAQTIAVCDYIEPLSAVILATLILREKMSYLQYVGAFMIIVGTIVWNIKLWRQKMTSVLKYQP